MMTPVPEYVAERGRVKSRVLMRARDGRTREIMRVFSHYNATQIAKALNAAFTAGLHWPPPRAK